MTQISFTREKAKKIVMGWDPGFKKVESSYKQIFQGVDSITAIIQDLKTGKYYQTEYTLGYKHYSQVEYRPFDTDDPIFTEVVPKEVVIKKSVWELADNKNWIEVSPMKK